MESKEQSGGKVSVKESIKYVSDLLTGLGVTGITPENFRLAKFNRLESPRCLLHALHGILTLVTKSSYPSLASSTTSFNSRKEQLAPPTNFELLESVCEGSADEDTLRVVKFHLALWRYPPHSPLFTLHASTHESRHFLLALGWILSRCNLIKTGLERRLQPFLALRSAAPVPHYYPLDMSFCPEALARAEKAECAVVDYVQRMIAATDRVEVEVMRMEMRADQILTLHGQVRACLKAIDALQETKVKKMHELQLAQLVAGEKQPHTAYEFHLLQHRKKLDMHCYAIAAAKAIEDEKEACCKHENLFWQWMESVAHEALAVQSQSPLKLPPSIDLAGVTDAELLPAIHYLKRKLATCEPKVDGATSSSYAPAPEEDETRKAILSESCKRNALIVDSCPSGGTRLRNHAKDIAKCLLRQRVFMYKPKKKSETRTVKATLRNDEDYDPQGASFRIQRLMELDGMVKRILARTRAENKVVLLELLKPIMEENFVVFGA